MKCLCENCPMYWISRDYWGEYDEGCEHNCDAWYSGENYKKICYMPRLIKLIYIKCQRRKEERMYKKYEKEHKNKTEC